VQQLSRLWDDYQTKVNEQLNAHISSYASHFPDAKVGKIYLHYELACVSIVSLFLNE